MSCFNFLFALNAQPLTPVRKVVIEYISDVGHWCHLECSMSTHDIHDGHLSEIIV